MKLVSAVLARNEASETRYLRRVLTRCLSFSDTVVVLDDGSTDATPDIAREMGCVVRTRDLALPAWGNESSARKELWDFACEYATGPNDWVLINDADQELVGDVRGLCKTLEANTWCFTLFDMWSPTEFRVDGFWKGHEVHRPWLVAPNRVPVDWTPSWGTRGVHVGHLPHNFPMVSGVAPSDSYYWLHYSYMKPEHRRKKYEQYMAVADQLSSAERAHAESIIAT